MTTEVNNGDPMLKIVLCEEDDLEDNPEETELTPKKSLKRNDRVTQSSRLASIRKHNGVRSANFVLTANPYQKRSVGCSNCQSMQNAKNNVSPFTQKIMSAKLLRFKQTQNQISEMSQKMNELEAENKILKTLQRRQDNALKKYEGSKEQLPQLIKSHNEEVRVINMKFKQLKITHKELENKLKQRDTELTNLREQHSHLLLLSRDKHLGDRDKLSKKLAALEVYSKEQNEKIVTLQRKLELQEKNFKHQLQIESQKHRDTQSQLLTARQINNSIKMKEGKEKVHSSNKRSDLQYEGYGYRSRASLPSPARHVIVESQRETVSEMATTSHYRISNQEREEESDSAPEVDSNIKVSVKMSGGAKRNLSKRSAKPHITTKGITIQGKSLQSPPTTTDSASSKASSNILPGKNSLSSNQSDEVPLKPAGMEIQNESLNQSFVASPRIVQTFRGGISIPSDLTIGNAARMRAVAVDPSSSEESDATEEDAEGRGGKEQEVEGNRRSSKDSVEVSDNDGNPVKNVSTLRARAEEDIDKIISKACDDMLSSDLEHDAILNGIENFSLTEELSQLKDLSWDEYQSQIKPMREELSRKIEKSLPSSDYVLDTKEKNHLLQALNMIDEETKPEDIGKLIVDEDCFIPSVEPERVKHQSVRQMFAQNRKKVDLMKSLFGSDSDPIAVSDGIN